eukprot:TRINITY_DN32106_c0_g1_i3.p2 TRINITY_DN32106_c0_g1~~TRINITY_DN32106_c0_g1_i3.p2  ORF type:complete len:131 (-),score=26.78 TRINITY_DN32106_c0_g1_i3:367-759(-)
MQRSNTWRRQPPTGTRTSRKKISEKLREPNKMRYTLCLTARRRSSTRARSTSMCSSASTHCTGASSYCGATLKNALQKYYKPVGKTPAKSGKFVGKEKEVLKYGEPGAGNPEVSDGNTAPPAMKETKIWF